MKKLLLILCLFLISNLFSLASVLIEPSRYILEIPPGEKRSDKISIVNVSDQPIHLKAVLYDWDLSDNGELVELEENSRDDSLSGLIKFNPREFTLAPGKSQIVRFTVQAPSDNLEHKGIVFFENSTSSAPSMMGTTITNKIGTTFYVSTPLVEMSLKFNDISLITENRQTSLNVSVDNIGKGHIRLLINYTLQTKDGKTIKVQGVPDQIILAGKSLNTALPIEADLEAGDYRLVLNLGYFGYKQRNQGVFEFSIP